MNKDTLEGVEIIVLIAGIAAIITGVINVIQRESIILVLGLSIVSAIVAFVLLLVCAQPYLHRKIPEITIYTSWAIINLVFLVQIILIEVIPITIFGVIL
jgi:hypothetical protein